MLHDFFLENTSFYRFLPSTMNLKGPSISVSSLTIILWSRLTYNSFLAMLSASCSWLPVPWPGEVSSLTLSPGFVFTPCLFVLDVFYSWALKGTPRSRPTSTPDPSLCFKAFKTHSSLPWWCSSSLTYPYLLSNLLFSCKGGNGVKSEFPITNQKKVLFFQYAFLVPSFRSKYYNTRGFLTWYKLGIKCVTRSPPVLNGRPPKS